MSMAENHSTHSDQVGADEKSAASGVLYDESVAQQPLSGQRVVRSVAFGSGASAATPDYVCTVKPRR